MALFYFKRVQTHHCQHIHNCFYCVLNIKKIWKPVDLVVVQWISKFAQPNTSFKNTEFLSWQYTFARLIETNLYYCIHQNITIDLIISQLHLIKQLQSTLSDPLQCKFSKYLYVFQFNASLQSFRPNFVPHFSFSQ